MTGQNNAKILARLRIERLVDELAGMGFSVSLTDMNKYDLALSRIAGEMARNLESETDPRSEHAD